MSYVDHRCEVGEGICQPRSSPAAMFQKLMYFNCPTVLLSPHAPSPHVQYQIVSLLFWKPIAANICGFIRSFDQQMHSSSVKKGGCEFLCVRISGSR